RQIALGIHHGTGNALGHELDEQSRQELGLALPGEAHDVLVTGDLARAEHHRPVDQGRQARVPKLETRAGGAWPSHPPADTSHSGKTWGVKGTDQLAPRNISAG